MNPTPAGQRKTRRRGPVRSVRGWPSRHAAAVAALAALALVLSPVLRPEAPAAAVGGRQTDAPKFYSGAAIVNRSATRPGRCTAGPVVMRSLTSVLRSGGRAGYEGSLRWIITAGHCGEVGDTFYSGDGRCAIGTADYKSDRYEVLTIKVEPATEQSEARGCFGGSGCFTCLAPGTRYIPRAAANVYIRGVRSVLSTGYVDQWTPRTDEDAALGYYFSGSTSGEVGAFPLRAASLRATAYVRALAEGERGTEGGDSGAPFYRKDINGDIKMIGWVSGTWQLSSGNSDVFYALSQYQETTHGHDKVIATLP